MNWKNRLTNYNFWISIVSAVLLILQAFEFHFDIAYINEIVTAVLGLLVVIGIINDPTKSNSKKETTNAETNTTADAIKVEEKTENVETDAVTNIEETEVKTTEESSETNVENIEDQTFPIDEENEIVDDLYENDIKNLVKTISDSNTENDKIKKMFENLLILLKNNEKTSKISENLKNFSQNTEILTENKEKELQNSNEEILEKTEIKLEETKQEISIEKEIIEEIVEPNLEETIEEKVENLDTTNLEGEKEIKTENNNQSMEETIIEVQHFEEPKTEIQQASSFNIVN